MFLADYYGTNAAQLSGYPALVLQHQAKAVFPLCPDRVTFTNVVRQLAVAFFNTKNGPALPDNFDEEYAHPWYRFFSTNEASRIPFREILDPRD